jgi:hypothetical protein
MAAKSLCNDIVHRFFHASPSVAEILFGRRDIVVKINAKRKHYSYSKLNYRKIETNQTQLDLLY